MKRRHNMVSLLFLLLLNTSSASAEDELRAGVETYDAPTIDLRDRLRLDISHYYPGTNDWLDAITTHRLPPGSLQYRFAGFHRFAVRHARSQYRRFVRRAVRKGWYVRPDEDYNEPLYLSPVERDFVGGFNNGAWWRRSWLDSLPPEKGGAPAVPYVQTIGCDTAWQIGPLTITNGLNLRLEHIGFFELNPNPVETQGAKPAPRATIDIHPPEHQPVRLTDVSFDVKPHIQVGIPRDGDWRSVLRGMSLRGSMEISRSGMTIVEGQAEIRWDPSDGVSVTFELAFVTW